MIHDNLGPTIRNAIFEVRVHRFTKMYTEDEEGSFEN
jgi:hypothetical protein